MTIEFAFDLSATKNDGSFEYRVYGVEQMLPRNRIMNIYDTRTGRGPRLFYVADILPNYTHKLMPLPTPKYVEE